ncbi:MAG: sulfatase [Acidobacteria bacterium]|nr:sulfatase [Acidobacteriota bacterium]
MALSRRRFLTAATAVPAACRRRDRRPNVVVIMTDDQRWDCLSCAGHPFLKTPNLDRVAAEGARFTNAFVTTSLCSPSRASFLSGLYAHSHGVLNNFTDYPQRLGSYPRALQAAGYQTAYVGKWHMGEQSDQARPGFHFWASHKGQGKYNDTEFNINGKRQVLEGYYSHRVTGLALDWIRRDHRTPFLLIIGHKAPHGVWIPEKKYERLFDNVPIGKPKTAYSTLPGKPAWVRERIKTWHGIEGPLYGTNDFAKFIRTYHATIPSVDDSVGQIYEGLRAKGELDNTLLVFLSDNGFLLGEHASIDKRTMWEESIRIPFLVRYPELIRRPRVIEQMLLNIDLAPGILDLCGLGPIEDVHGRSFKPLLDGRPANWRKSFFYEYNFESEFPYTPNVRGVRTDDWKYIHYPNGDGQPETHKAELYNLKADPQETNNLIDDNNSAGMLDELRSELGRLQRETGASPDRMPVNPVLRMEMPEQSIR